MANFCIVTNNPDVAVAYGGLARVVAGGVDSVFFAVRDAVHLGAMLISHPLAGSVKPGENPYRSVVVSTAQGPVDTASLAAIEDAIAVLRRLPARAGRHGRQVLDDFKSLDLDLVRSAMGALPAQYHQHAT